MFSIIIPVYNVGKYLRWCLESVKNQTFQDWECICIDDGSTDGSGAVCESFAATDPRFHIVHQKNGGVSAARNCGLEHSVGEWVLFVDADDLIHPEMLMILADCIQSNKDAEIIYFDYCSGEKISFPVIEQKNNTAAYLQDGNLPELNLWRCCFQKNIIGLHKFKNYIMGEDLLFTAEVLMESGSVYYLPLCLYGYRKRTGSVMTRIFFRRSADDMLWMAEIFRLYTRNPAKISFAVMKRRWHQFFFKMADEILHFSGMEQKKLIQIWFDELRKLDDVRIYARLDQMRKIYLYVGKNCFFLQFFLLRINQIIFRCYTVIHS